VAGMTDMFVLLQLPNAGDDLQAIKRGVMELADLIVINKADLDEAAATRARAQITSALRLLSPHGRSGQDPGAERGLGSARAGALSWHTPVLQLSALTHAGLDAFWVEVRRFRDLQIASGRLVERRHAQDERWMWERIEAGLRQRFREHPAVSAALPGLGAEVRAGRMAASSAARRLLDLCR